jgi:hypothetical protein
MTRKSIIVLFVLAFSSISILGHYIHPVKATWVQGHVTQDTIWTAQDSPYVVISSLIVDSNVMLAIEAGVEVRFGGNFSLTVQGSLNATGNVTSPIVFTSNKLSPLPGDWNAIVYSTSPTQPNRSLTVRRCIVRYAAQITIGTGGDCVGTVIVDECKFENCKNGIYAFDWHGASLVITGNSIENAGFGLGFANDIQNASVSGNSIRSCGSGIQLGFFVSPYYWGANFVKSSIYNNVITSSTMGINVAWGMHHQLLIRNNSLSSNQYGIFVDSTDALDNWPPVEPAWSNNTIAFNNYGIFMTGRSRMDFQICFNDIYSNSYGLNVSRPDHNYNATYDYWGDPSGPYHESLNPLGKGNSVNGNGNVVFIPYLTAQSGALNQPPQAILKLDKNNPSVNETVTFDASSSTDDGRIDYYLFDFGDGANSSWTSLSAVTHSYSQERAYNVTLTVMDDFGVTSTNTQQATVQVIVVPESPFIFILPLFVTVTLLAVVTYRKKHGVKAISV